MLNRARLSGGIENAAFLEQSHSMRTETDEFITDYVEWEYAAPHEITGDRMAIEPEKVGVQFAGIHCKKCGHRWRASEGKKAGQFRSLVGGIYVRCENCANEGRIPLMGL
jgi:hypothetical protein